MRLVLPSTSSFSFDDKEKVTLSRLVSRSRIMMASNGEIQKTAHATKTLHFRLQWGELLFWKIKWPHAVCSSCKQLCVRSHWLLNTVPTHDLLTPALFLQQPFLCFSAGCAWPPVDPLEHWYPSRRTYGYFYNFSWYNNAFVKLYADNRTYWTRNFSLMLLKAQFIRCFLQVQLWYFSPVYDVFVATKIKRKKWLLVDNVRCMWSLWGAASLIYLLIFASSRLEETPSVWFSIRYFLTNDIGESYSHLHLCLKFPPVTSCCEHLVGKVILLCQVKQAETRCTGSS